ncbi:MAG: hypothetical protein ACFFAN_20300 [Promethearchaeota archaeon]
MIKDFKIIGDESNINKILRHLREGYGFGDTYLNLLEYVQDLYKYSSNNSDIEVFKNSIKVIKQYDEIYFIRLNNLKRSLGDYDSHFERDVHIFLKNEINSIFMLKIPLVKAIGKRKICYTDNFGNIINKNIDLSYHYDFYLELDANLREFFNLSNKWKSIAVEAQGSYWHGDDFSDNIKSDEFKKLVSKLEDIILIEIWDNIEKNLWNSEFYNQLKKYRELK